MIVQKARKNEWKKLINQSNKASFFHSSEWLYLIEKMDKNSKEDSLEFLFSDGSIAFMPIIKKTSRGRFFNINLFESSALGTYGGLISNKKLSLVQYKQIFKWLNKNLKNYIIRISPYDDFHITALRKISGVDIENDFSHIIYLEDGFDKISNNFSKGHKYNIKKAKEYNVKIIESKKLSEYLEYYNVYLDSCKRWGKKTGEIDVEFFKNVFKLLGKNSKLWLAKKDGKIISGALVFYYKDKAVWWNGATLEKYFQFYPANLIQNIIIEDALNSGYRYYDLNPSDNLEGVIKFKENFGAKKVESSLIIKRSFVQLISSFMHKIKTSRKNKKVLIFLNDNYGREYLIKYLSLVKKYKNIDFKIIFSTKNDYKNNSFHKKIIKILLRKISPKNFTEKLLRENKIKYWLVGNINSKKFINKINDSVGIISGFDQIFNEKTIDKFKILINFHPSLLPSYRGPTPSFWAINNKEKFSGISVHRVSSIIDSGEILFNDFLKISSKDNEQSLDKRLSVLGSKILEENFEKILNNKIDKKIKFPIGKLKPSYYSVKKI